MSLQDHRLELLSTKDNGQSRNLEALIDAGIGYFNTPAGLPPSAAARRELSGSRDRLQVERRC